MFEFQCRHNPQTPPVGNPASSTPVNHTCPARTDDKHLASVGPTHPATAPVVGIEVVTEELTFAVLNRTGLSFGVISMVLFAAQAHQAELAADLASVQPIPTPPPPLHHTSTPAA